MRKFYKLAEAGTAPSGFVVRLDGKMLKTPLKNNLIFPTQSLADAIAVEWNAQGKILVPEKMPLTQLANTMLDKSSGADRAALNAELVRYAASDLVCYFAPYPADIVKRQETQWLPLLDWMKETHGAELVSVRGIQYINQSDEYLAKVGAIITALDPLSFTVMQAVTGIASSVVIGLAFAQGRLDAKGAYDAACVDETYQLDKWGDDVLARQKLATTLAELEAISLFKSSF